MFKNSTWALFIIFAIQTLLSQTQVETIPPFNIKTVTFLQNATNVVPIFKLGEGFQLQFDDLIANEDNYYFEIIHCDYNWVPSSIPKNEYMRGMDNQRILQYDNSINTLQLYSHYVLPIPNQFMSLTLSGNYLLKILDENKDLVFSRKFILHEALVTVPMQIKRARTADALLYKHNLDFTIKSAQINFQTPLKNVKIAIIQNGQMNTAIKNIAPQYTIGNDLVYKYDKETQFWAGNEFLFFDNNNIRGTGNNVSLIDSANGIYNSRLFTNNARKDSQYTLAPDANGNFVVRSIGVGNNEIESDYAWVYFSLFYPYPLQNKNIHINGMFNNYALTEDNKMDYNKDKNIYEKALFIKQGFTNYQYQITDNQGVVVHKEAPDGNFWQTENEYILLVYYRENNDRYQRVIGKTTLFSTDVTN